jgi:hypothetical protein
MTEPTKPAREGDYGLLRDAADITVEGSLAQPPIVLRQDRLKLGIGFVLSAGLTLGLLAELRLDTTVNILLFGFIALTALDYGLATIFPARLILGPDGLVRRSVYGTTRYSWQDLTGFRWYRTRTSVNMILAKRSSGVETQLGGYWELPVQQVVDRLIAALAQWGPKT